MSAERNGNDIELLSAYLDGQLTEAERSALEARLEQDAELRRNLAQLRATVEIIRGLPELTAPRDFRLSHMMVYGQRRQRRATVVFSFMSAAAAVVLLVTGVLLTLTTRTTPPASLTSDVARQEAISMVATDAANASPVPTAALADTVPPEEAAGASRLVEPEGGADDQFQQPEAPLMFAVPTGTQFELEQAAPAADTAFSASSAVARGEPLNTVDELRGEATLEFQAFGEAPEADAADEEEAPAAGMLAQPTQPPPAAAQPTLPPPTPTAAPTSTPLPTDTLPATVTPLPTLPPSTPVPVPPVQQTDSSALGIVLIVVAVVLLAVSIFAFLLSRRR